MNNRDRRPSIRQSQPIRSTQHPRQIQHSQSSRPARVTQYMGQPQAAAERKTKQQVVYGLRPVIEAIDSGLQIDRLLLQKGLSGNLVAELKSKILQAEIPFQYVPVEKLDKLTTGNHQGVVATVAPVRYHHFAELLQQVQEAGRVPFFLLLDRVTDVRNMGAIVRTAECVGVDAVIVPDRGSAQLNEDALKTSSGALLRVPLCRESNFKTVLNLACQSGLQVVAATEKAHHDYLEVDFRQPLLLIMGSEETGISNDLLRLCDKQARIPIRGEVQSLNVSVAAAVMMYEVLRQRGLG